MFIFLLTPFDTWDCYYFKLNLSQVLLIKVLFIKKACKVFFSLLKWKNNFATWVYFSIYPVFQLGNIGKFCLKWGVQKKYNMGGWPYQGVVYRSRGFNYVLASSTDNQTRNNDTECSNTIPPYQHYGHIIYTVYT